MTDIIFLHHTQRVFGILPLSRKRVMQEKKGLWRVLNLVRNMKKLLHHLIKIIRQVAIPQLVTQESDLTKGSDQGIVVP